MSQKSSVPQAASFVSGVLKPDSALPSLLTALGVKPSRVCTKLPLQIGRRNSERD
jgi:hypothetical protein